MPGDILILSTVHLLGGQEGLVLLTTTWGRYGVPVYLQSTKNSAFVNVISHFSCTGV